MSSAVVHTASSDPVHRSIAPQFMSVSQSQSMLLSLTSLVASLSLATLLVVRVLLGEREQGLRVAM